MTTTRFDPYCALWAGVVAGVLATAVQVLLWIAFTDQWPAVLWRDARLAAAIVLGPQVLPPPATFNGVVVAVATVLHFALSIVYACLLALLIDRRGRAVSWVLGAGFGAVLFVVNMYGFTLIFPWFTAVRDAITLVAHVAFGVLAAEAYRRCR